MTASLPGSKRKSHVIVSRYFYHHKSMDTETLAEQTVMALLEFIFIKD